MFRTSLCFTSVLRSLGAFFEDVIVNRVYRSKRFSGYIGIWNAHAECLFHTHDQLQRVDGIKAQSIRTEKRQIITDLFGSNLQHQISDQHFFDLGAQIRLRHKRAGILP